MKILVVEDSDIFRRLICSKLESRAEFAIMQASDGVEALQKAEDHQPDLILLDIGLPRLDGIAVAKRMGGVAPVARIIFLTVESDPELIQEALRLGALGYIHKSSLERDLLPAIYAAAAGERYVSQTLDIAKRTNELRHRHDIVFSSEVELLQDSLARFIAAALKSGDAAIVWVTKSHLDTLGQRLQVRGVDVDAAIRTGIYIAADAAETADVHQIAQIIESLARAANRAGKERPRVAACGERAGRLWAEGRIDEALRIEQLFNELLKSRDDLDVLCVYPLPHRHDGQSFSHVCEGHSAIFFR